MPNATSINPDCLLMILELFRKLQVEMIGFDYQSFVDLKIRL
jgi:hypothetical protein